MNIEDIASKRAEHAKYLLQENRMRAVTRATIDAINIKKYREQLKHDGIFRLLKKYIDTNPPEALKLLEKMNAFEFESINPNDNETTEGLTF